jgi:hypothetical protein
MVLSRSEQYEIQHPYVRELLEGSLKANPTLESLWYASSIAIISDETADARNKLRAILAAAENHKGEMSTYSRIVLTVMRLIDCTDVSKCVDEILANSENSTLLSALLAGDILPVNKRLNVLNLVIKKLRQAKSPNWKGYIPLARKALDTRKSDLTNSTIWNAKLQFPAESFASLLPVVAPGN